MANENKRNIENGNNKNINNSGRKRKKKTKKKWKVFLRISLLLILVAVIITGGAVAGMLIGIIKSAPEINPAKALETHGKFCNSRRKRYYC